MRFSNIKINGWRQFKEIDIDFHPRITIITGANGAGKSTLLRILSQHYGWSVNLLATPTISTATGVVKYTTDLLRRISKGESTYSGGIGSLLYSNGICSKISVPWESGVQYNVSVETQQPVIGLHINSHRHLQNYQPITSIPTSSIGAAEAYQNYFSEVISKYQGGFTQSSPTHRMKESIISMAMFGPGNANVQGNPVLAKLFSDFKKILLKILPENIGFEDISVRIPDVVLVTKSGEFLIDAASGGLMAIIDLAWQIFLFSQDKAEFVVTMDEPENHLHPSMQRSLLSRLADAFPGAQFIIATHSPFVVSSVSDSLVYALKYVEAEDEMPAEYFGGSVSSMLVDLDSKAATANEILRDVLGVPVTLPEWAEDELKRITRGFVGKSITEDSLNQLREELAAGGLSEYFPDALKIIASPI
jgi:ABC-type cobalamin/Fe3+-siderophores transport system ATPase subunit